MDRTLSPDCRRKNEKCVVTMDLEKLKRYRRVVLFLNLGVLWKAIFLPFLYYVYDNYPLQDPFFPSLLRSTTVLRGVMYLVQVALCLSLFQRQLIVLRSLIGIAFGGLLILNLHQGTYNDVTYLTAWWTSLWCMWYLFRFRDPPIALHHKGTFLAMSIVSLIFLGGAVGKLTPGYWSGDIMYEIYFADREFWLFQGLRRICHETQLRTIAMVYSRLVICVELGCAGLWLLPARWAGYVGIFVLSSIALLSNWLLFSVVFNVIGLCAFCLFPAPRSDEAPKVVDRSAIAEIG